MNKKIFLTESDKKKIISEKEKMIIESFTNIFNKIKRIDEDTVKSEQYQVYHISLLSALSEAEKYVNKKGFEIPVDGFEKFSFGGISYGTTKKDNINLLKNGEPTKNKFLAIQIYRMESGNYELNMYLT